MAVKFSFLRLPLLIVLPLVLALPIGLRAQQSPYVDPALRALLRPAAQQALRNAVPVAGKPAPQALALDVAVRRNSVYDVPMVSLFARIRDEAAIADVQSAGGSIGSRVGSMITVDVPLEKLSALLASPHFTTFEASHTITVSNDSSMKVIRADLVRRASGGTWTGTAGRGVIVGFVDTGIDFTHDDFLDSNGAPRVLEVWDQTDQSGAPPAGMSYGRYCNQGMLATVVANPADRTACPEIDRNGHGTHVAGSAAGDGSAVGAGGTPFTYAGVAPLADIISVKAGEGTFSQTNVVDGLVWLEREARRLNKPMVVNLSLGTQSGAHDGTSIYETTIDSLSRAGFIVVVSAGNEGYNENDFNPDGTAPPRLPTYFHGSGAAGTSRDFTIDIHSYVADTGTCNDFVNFGLWYNSPDMLDVSVVRPDGGVVTAPFAQVKETDSAFGNVRIDNASSGVDPANNAYEADIRINDCGSGSPPVAGSWTIRVSSSHDGSGKPYHLWMYGQSLGSATMAFGAQNFDNHYVVSTPGNARSAVTVGAFFTKLCWNSPAKPDGPVCFTTREAVGDLARFSSGGPTRDGRLKPEITAPGLGIASARSRFASPAANRILFDGVHWINQGTSMAAPMVSGAIALLLQVHPTLTADGVKNILAQASDHDSFTSRVYDASADALPQYWWGYGKLNVCAALSVSGGATGADSGPVVITPAADTIPVNATTRFFSCSPAGGLIAFRSANSSIATVDANGTVHALQVGQTQIIAVSGAFADTADVVVTAPATLAITLRSVAPATTTLGKRGTQLPLLATTLRADGYEAIRVTQLSYRITGIDPAARIDLVVDANRNGVIDEGERTIASRQAALSGTPLQIDVQPDSLIVAQRDSVNLILAVEISGTQPNGAAFAAEFIPSGTHTTDIRSAATDRVTAPSGPLASSIAATTLLADNETFSLSENPVRSGRVVFNFASAPRSAAVYTLTGRRVADLKPRMIGNSVTWDLTNDNSERVATGAYLVLIDLGGSIIKQKLFVIAGAQ